MSDCISRQAVHYYIESHINEIITESGVDKNEHTNRMLRALVNGVDTMPSVIPTERTGHWIPVSERLPEDDKEVLLWVKNKSHPDREPSMHIGSLTPIKGSDGSDNFWGIETKDCDWTIWAWSYFSEPNVIAWMPLPKPYEPQESEDKG